MPGRLFLERDLAQVCADVSCSVPTDFTITPRRNIAPGQEVLVVTEQGLQMMRWGMIPVGRVNARGRPVMETIINARSETVFDKSAFEGTKRCVVPADGWYEWIGEKRKKTAWRIAPKDKSLLYFAAISDVWTAPGGVELRQVATVTCAPNADIAPIHHRMGVLLHADQIDSWITGADVEAHRLCQPFADGKLQITAASDVDWNGA